MICPVPRVDIEAFDMIQGEIEVPKGKHLAGLGVELGLSLAQVDANQAVAIRWVFESIFFQFFRTKSTHVSFFFGLLMKNTYTSISAARVFFGRGEIRSISIKSLEVAMLVLSRNLFMFFIHHVLHMSSSPWFI